MMICLVIRERVNIMSVCLTTFQFCLAIKVTGSTFVPSRNAKLLFACLLLALDRDFDFTRIFIVRWVFLYWSLQFFFSCQREKLKNEVSALRSKNEKLENLCRALHKGAKETSTDIDQVWTLKSVLIVNIPLVPKLYYQSKEVMKSRKLKCGMVRKNKMKNIPTCNTKNHWFTVNWWWDINVVIRW